MASRKSSRGAGGSPSPGSKRETKHGGGKNGKKEGLSGSSFFTWFMVIALLGVWTSVAVVWFELVDYEEVLAKAKDFRYNLSEVLQGKLGMYDADGDGDFDVEDAKVLLGIKHNQDAERPQYLLATMGQHLILESEEPGGVAKKKTKVKGLKERSVPAQPPSPDSEETAQPAEKSYVKSEFKSADIDLEDGIQSVLHEALHSPPVSYEYDVEVEKTVSYPEAPGDSELMLEDAMEHFIEDRVHDDYSEDHAVEDLPEEVNEATEPDQIIEDFDTGKELPVESKLREDVGPEPEQSETRVQAEDYSNDDRVAKKKKPKLLNKFDKTIKAELDAAEKLRKKGKVEEALRAFEALVNQYPQSPRARYGKAQSEDDLAEKMRSNEMLQKAINTYDEVVTLPNVPSDLIKLSLKREADRQQFLGRMRGSLITLQKLVQLFPSDTSFKNDLGVGYLLIGDNSNAKKVYEEVLSISPNDGFAKVHYGFILKAENKIAESIPYLKEGLESGDPGTNDGRFYFHLGDALQRMGDEEAYKWYELGYQRGHFASVWQRSLYNVKGLKAQPWWTARETGYTELVKSLEKSWKIIRDEGLAVMDKKRSLFLPEDENLREKGDWSQFTLWQQGRKNENACKSVPKTCALLERFPEATGCRRGQIKYSIMHPGTHVWPHTGPTNCRLRMHLGLVIPKEGCKIRCAQDNRTWEEGKVLIFDDSFEHEVWQDAETYRLIFIVDVWHPELTAQERRTLPAI
ncbi:aspartyl/asparaginyl beta-hydroxylase isoform X17 [Heliangelus exortis]|uniref:aspartyl/asparaginyl beta-hydroxylase isoform X17 n=1 Tax=Heliangelus exortis TaxID=472823 RepID=UPI003A946F9B